MKPHGTNRRNVTRKVRSKRKVSTDGTFIKSYITHPAGQTGEMIVGDYRKAKLEELTPDQQRHIEELRADEIFFKGTLEEVHVHLSQKSDQTSKFGAHVIEVALRTIPELTSRPSQVKPRE